MTTGQTVRYMLRESRGSLGRLGFFIACLAVGVAAVVAVAGLSEGLAKGVGREARQLMAADLAIEGSLPLSDELEAALDAETRGKRVDLKEMATVVSVPRTRDGETSALGPVAATSQLVELKSVEGAYPFYGELKLEPQQSLSELLSDHHTVVAPDLLERLELRVGDTLRIGTADFEIAGVVLSEPDRVGMALTAGPRVFVSGRGLERADLERFGSRITYRTLIQLPASTGVATVDELNSLAETIRAWPAMGPEYRVSTYAEAQPAVERALQRVDRFLGLVALLSLLLGGVGVAQTTRAWLEGRTDAMAILRAIGFRPGEVFRLYLFQTIALGLIGSLIGVVAGTAVLAIAPSIVADLLPDGLGISAWQPMAALRGLGLGLGAAVLFSLAPLTAVRRIPPLRVLRKDAEPIQPSRATRLLLGSLLFAGVVGAAALQASSILYGLAFAASLAVAAAVLAGAAFGAFALLRRISKRRMGASPTWLRHGVSALVRPGAGTVGAVVALGLGVLLLLGMALVQAGLSGQLSTALPEGAPSAFLIDIQKAQWGEVQKILNNSGARSINSAPVVTARFARIGDESVDDLVEDNERGERRWALTREQRVTYLDALAPDNKILERADTDPNRSEEKPDDTQLWTDPDRWELSVEEDYARSLGLTVGSAVALDVQGVPVDFVVTNIRSVDWGTFDLNFYLVAEPAALEEAPQYRIATVDLPEGSQQITQDRLAAVYPNVTMIRIRDVLDKIRDVLERLAFGVQFLGAFTVLAGLVILAGAVSASSIRRRREIAVLKTLGMVRREVILMFTVEFALLGLLAGTVGALGGVILARTVLTRGMEIAWRFEPLPVVLAIGATVVLTALAAVLAGSRALAARPLEVLRAD